MFHLNQGSTFHGLLFAGTASLFFSVQNAITKTLQAHYGMPVFEIILARSLMVTLFLCSMALYQRTSLFGQRENRKYLVSYGVLRIVAISVCFFAIGVMPLYAVTIILFTYPCMACILAHLLLGEPYGLFDICSTVCSLLGVVLISEPAFLSFPNKVDHQHSSGSEDNWFLGAFLGFSGAAVLSIATVVIRKLGGREASNVVIFYQNGVGLLVAPIGLAVEGARLPGIGSMLLMLTIPGIAICAQTCQTLALGTTAASKTLPMSYLEVLFSSLIGTIFLGETMDWFQIAGAGVMVISAFSYFFKEDTPIQLQVEAEEMQLITSTALQSSEGSGIECGVALNELQNGNSFWDADDTASERELSIERAGSKFANHELNMFTVFLKEEPLVAEVTNDALK